MSQNAMKKHEDFILGTLVPAIFDHARRVGSSPDEAALAVFLSMGTILNTKGFTQEILFNAIRDSALNIHDSPEWLQ